MTHSPRRTCVACRQVRDKRELVRLVRRAEGTVVVDGTGRAAGRGAYVCRDVHCAARLVKGGRLSQAFRRPCQAEADLVVTVAAQGSGGRPPVEGAVVEGTIMVTDSINPTSAR